jgi:acyl carrier protein phosphodiesterase
MDILQSASGGIAGFARRLFIENVSLNRSNPDLFSPLVPNAIYQAAVAQYRLWKQSGLEEYKRNMDSMRLILGGFCRRWQVADLYVESFDSLNTAWPSTLLLVQRSP